MGDYGGDLVAVCRGIGRKLGNTRAYEKAMRKEAPKKQCNRSQVQGSTFRVRDKDKIEDPKFS